MKQNLYPSLKLKPNLKVYFKITKSFIFPRMKILVSSSGIENITKSTQRIVPAGKSLSLFLNDGLWFGQGHLQPQPFVLNRATYSLDNFAVNNVQSPVWLCSCSAIVMAETAERLTVRCNTLNNGRIEIACPSRPFAVRIIIEKNLALAHAKLLKILKWPPQAPAKSFFGDSIFCTWTQYPRCITSDRILSMAKEIRKNDFPCSVLTIDDRWESAFGELEFGRDFPDPKAMVKALHKQGFKVLLWVTPFVNQEASTFAMLEEKGFLVPSRADNSKAALFKWWGGTAGLVDLTRPQARKWYKEKLLFLQKKIGIDGFKIDGGDAKYQPLPEQSAWHDFAGPSGYSDKLLSVFEEVAPNLCETRTAWMSQSRSILWRQGGKDSFFGPDNGLTAMVRLAMTMPLLGYDVFIPDMIPGRVQTMISNLALPTDELMVRWTEISAFMPIMQFSYFPWNYCKKTLDVVRGFAQVHKSLEEYLHKAAKNRKKPLLRPLWYDWPSETGLYRVDDEYMLGEDVLAAPVLASGIKTRHVVLPPGKWLCAWTGKEFGAGPIPEYPCPCPGMPLFVRKEAKPLFKTLNKALSGIKRGSVGPNETTTAYKAGLDRDLKVTG